MKYIKLFESFGSEDEKWDYFFDKIEKGDEIITEEWQECPDDLKKQYIDMMLAKTFIFNGKNKSLHSKVIIYNKVGNNPKFIFDISSDEIKQYYFNKIVEIGGWFEIEEFQQLTDEQKVKWFSSFLNKNKYIFGNKDIINWFKNDSKYYDLIQQYEDNLKGHKQEIADTIELAHGKEASKKAADYMGLQKHEYGFKDYSEMSEDELNDALNKALDKKNYELAKEISKYIKESLKNTLKDFNKKHRYITVFFINSLLKSSLRINLLFTTLYI